ncbi:MAG: exonuclease SbcCD subunit D [[Ruminococcus] torques]
MKFIHLSDLHIGKHLYHYNMKEDQEHILEEVIGYTEKLRPDAVVIAGDIYDKSVPSAEAVAVFDDFLTRLSSVSPQVSILIIAGNHDSAQRLDYASRLLGSRGIYIAGKAPETEKEHLKKVVLKDEYGPVNFYLLPFLKPGYVRLLCGDAGQLYRGCRCGFGREDMTFRAKRTLSHQFYTGNGETPETCDSELFSVGGIDNVDISAISRFDYAALGHLHKAQRVGAEHIRYCGTLLKYSVSEADLEKSLHLVTIGQKKEAVTIEKFPLHPLRDVQKVRGCLSEILSLADPKKRDDYVSVTLTDEIDPYRPKEQLEKVYSRILEVRTDNERTRKKLEFKDEDIRMENPLETFSDFYEEMHGRKMSLEEAEMMTQIFDDVKGEER